MTDYGAFSFEDKQEVLDKAKEFWNPGKTQFWIDSGTPLVIDRREGYLLWDMSGRRLIDAHLNGGTYNVGHRNQEVVSAVAQAMHRFDIGNHHFPSLARTALAEALIASAPPGLTKVIYASGGGEAIDIAIKTARHATGKRKIVSIVKAYHGHTGLAVTAGDDRFAKLFLADRPDEVAQVPFNDLAAMQPTSAPPNVDMCAKPSSVSHPAHRSLTSTAAIGYIPPESPLPVTRRSGAMSCLVMHHSSPVRIKPVCTSSAT